MDKLEIVLSQTESGSSLFETRTPIPALLYRRGSPPKCTNLECAATLQCYAYPEGWLFGIWVEGIHIRVPLADIHALVAAATETLNGFGTEENQDG